jgi:hypothetical protein
MTEHKATPGQWAADRYDWARADTEALDGNSAFRCIMELRSRVEALEGSTTKEPDRIGEVNKMVPDRSLVERVQAVIWNGYPDDARAAILEVATWLRQREARVMASVQIAADLERETKR